MTEVEDFVDMISEMSYIVESMHQFLSMTPYYINQEDASSRELKIEMINSLNTIKNIRGNLNFNNLKKELAKKIS